MVPSHYPKHVWFSEYHGAAITLSELIEPSLRESFQECHNVKITESPTTDRDAGTITYNVTCTSVTGEPWDETYTFIQIPLYYTPTTL